MINRTVNEALNIRTRLGRGLPAVPMIQATTFVVVGKLIETLPTRRMAPLFTAYVENSDGSVLDSRTAFNEFALYDWLESFGLSPRPPRLHMFRNSPYEDGICLTCERGMAWPHLDDEDDRGGD